MVWTGKFWGALIGLLSTRSVWGAVVGALIGHLFDQNSAITRSVGGSSSVSEVFFRTAFELFGHVAKADGQVSVAQIDAARTLMQELKLGPDEIAVAIACFRAGKAPDYAVERAIEGLRQACGPRTDLLISFMELQLRAALAGNGLSPPARSILLRVAAQLGVSELQFAHMEASLRAASTRARQQAGHGSAPLADSYAELEVDPRVSNQELTKAYRRQMSRHHPDKLVANGLPESMAQFAKEKTQRIQEAYESLRTARGMR